MTQKLPDAIDAYIAGYPPEIQEIMKELRETIRRAAPEAGEKISWGMATFTLYGNLVHFSGQKHHIGFHPAPSAIENFQDQLADYKYSKGTIQFPYERPIPLDLVEKIVKFRVEEQKKQEAEKKQLM